MARTKLLVFAAIAIGLLVWNLLSVPKPSAAPPPQTSAPAPVANLDGPAGAVKALLDARSAWERAAAQSAISSEPLVAALAAAAKNGGTPGADAADPLKAAADQALASFPEAARHYVVVALATATGALASVPGHEPLMAAAFPWIEEALKAGPTGYAADVAGKKVMVYAAPVRAVVKDEVKELGSLAIAFSRDPADWAPFVDASPAPFTLVAGGKVIASSDKSHSDALSSTSSAGPSTFKGGNAFAVAVPGIDGAFAVVASSASAPAMSAPAPTAASGNGSLNLEISIGVMIILAIVFAGLMPGDPLPMPARDTIPPASQVRVDDEALRYSLNSAKAAAPAPAPEPIPEPRFPASAPPAPAPAPPAPAPAQIQAIVEVEAPPPLPAAPAASTDPSSSFEDLFGAPAAAAAPAPSPAPSSGPPPLSTSPAMAARAPAVVTAPSTPSAPTTVDPLGFLSSTKPSDEKTGAMSRDQLSSLAAQSSMGEAIPLPSTGAQAAVPLPSTTSGSGAIPLPSSAAPDPFALASEGQPPMESHERTVVQAVPQELLRAAGQRPPTGGPGVAGPLAATANAEELHFQDVYREFLQVRERCGEPQENLTFEKFSAKLRKNKEQLVAKYACKSVRFQVYVKEGKAALKATPVKDA